MSNMRGLCAALTAGLVLILSVPGQARPWKPSPSALALDYLQIMHQKPQNEVVLVWWVASPMMENRDAVKDVLDKYVLLALVDAHVDKGGSTAYTVGDLALQDGSGKTLKRVADADMLTATIAGLRAMMQQMLGQMGKGMQIFAFDAGQVQPCTKGALSVLYGGENYTYDTPIPGCSAG